ncbi:MAG: hypothetical protein ACREJB_05330 [Planctomycetaceae bacterium]
MPFSRRRRFGRLVRLAPLLALVPVLAGCNYLMLAGLLIGGFPSIEPKFDKMTGQSMTDKDVTVAVVCYVPTDVKYSFNDLDQKMQKYVSYRLHEHQIQVVNPDRVHAWLDENPEWDYPEEIGAALGVKYVIYIDISKFSLYEENSAHLYRGRAEAVVSVFEMDEDGAGEKIFSQEAISAYPLAVPRDSHEISYQNFEREYLSHLSERIGRMFYEYYNGDDIPDAT